MKFYIFMVILILSSFSCGLANSVREGGNWGNSKPAIDSYTVGKAGAFKVDFLFEIEGVKMYRFVDNKHTRYFGVKEGEVTTTSTTSVKKDKKTEYQENSLTVQ